MSVLALGLFVAAVGTVAATYSETFEATVAERIRYEVGADLRAVAVSPALPASAEEALRPLDESPDVRAAGAATRQLGQLGVEQSGAGAVLLALQPDRFADILQFRGDFAGTPLASILDQVRADPAPAGIELPLGARGLALWVRTDPPTPGLLVTARIVGADGRPRTVTLGEPRGDAWQRLQSDFAAEEPVRLIALAFSAVGAAVRAPAGILWFDDLAVVTPGGEQVIASFDNAAGWFSGEGELVGGDRVRSDRQSLRRDSPTLRYEWRRLQGGDQRFLVRESSNLPIPVAMSGTAMRAAGIGLGDIVPFALPNLSLPLRVVVEIDLFPTLDPANGGLIVADLSAVQSAGVALSRASFIPITEVWIDAKSDRVIAGLARSLDAIYLPALILDARALLQEAQSDPFSASGAGGLFLVGFVGLLTVAMIAIVLLFAASAQERTLEISVLRTLGYGRLSATLQAAAESAVLLGVGAAVGVLAGRQIAGSLLAFLDVTATGAEAVPPLLLRTDWGIASAGIAALIGIGAAAIALLARIAAARSVAEVVRTNDV